MGKKATSPFILPKTLVQRSDFHLHPNNELFADSILHQGYSKAFLFIQHKDAKLTDLLAMYVFLNRIFTGFFFLSKEEKSRSVLGNLNVPEGQGQHSRSSESSYRRQHPEVSAVPSNYYPTLYRNLTWENSRHFRPRHHWLPLVMTLRSERVNSIYW